MKYYLAIDIGASSGRHIVGKVEDGVNHPSKILTEELYRFKNGVTELDGHLIWDIESLCENVKAGVRLALEKYPEIESVAIDTWGVDYVLLDKNGEAILPVYAYRDSRTEAVIDEVHSIVPFETLYSKTGIQFQPFNTIYQLYDDKKHGRLDRAESFLMIPEYLSYILCGASAKEYTNATTTGLLCAATGEYDRSITDALGLPGRLFTKLSKPRTVLGTLEGTNVKVVLCASHDTASAVEGIGLEGFDQMYVSSGTWSLLGVKSPAALTDDGSRRANYSNEGGIGYIRYQKNIMGMWTVNRLQSELCADKNIAVIADEAHESTLTLENYVDVNHDDFLAPKSMKETFERHARAAGFELKCEADYFRCAFNSLAHSYDRAIRELESNTGKTYDSICIVGGGAKNKFLNELTETATGKKVIALPIEATAIGNLWTQAR